MKIPYYSWGRPDAPTNFFPFHRKMGWGGSGRRGAGIYLTHDFQNLKSEFQNMQKSGETFKICNNCCKISKIFMFYHFFLASFFFFF